MTKVRSSKGQVVLPQAARRRLPRETMLGRPRFVKDKLTGMVVAESPKGLPVLTGEHVRSLLANFP